MFLVGARPCNFAIKMYIIAHYYANSVGEMRGHKASRIF